MFHDNRFKTDPIQWHEGMPLAPQHFQLNDKRVQSLFSSHLKFSFPFNYGLIDLQHDDVALSNGSFKILEAQAVMPDGFFVQYKESKQTVPLEVDVSGLDFSLTSSAHKVFLCMPVYYNGEPSAAGNHPRYISVEGDIVVDENGSFSESTRIPRLAPNLNLIAGSPPSSRYVSLPIAELIKRDGRIILSTYTPPSLSLSEGQLILRTCRELAARIRQKISSLSEKLDPMSDNPTDSQAKLFLRTLLTSVLPYESTVSTTGLHPYEYYQALISLGASISALRLDIQDRVVFPSFDQSNIGGCFGDVLTFIEQILTQMGEHVERRVFQQKQGYFGVHIPFVWRSKKIIVGVRVNGEATQADTYAWIQNSIIGSQSVIRSLTDKRVVGAARKLVESDSSNLIRVSKDIILFEIDAEDFVKRGEVLYVFNPSDKKSVRPLELYLYITEKDI